MKDETFIFRLLLVLSIAVFFVSMAFAAPGKQDFQLVNKTGVEIHQLYISPHDVNDWQEDVLGREPLPDGESVKVSFDNRENRNKWDLKIVDGKGSSIEWEDLDLTKTSEVILHYKDGKGWADVK